MCVRLVSFFLRNSGVKTYVGFSDPLVDACQTTTVKAIVMMIGNETEVLVSCVDLVSSRTTCRDFWTF